MNIYLVIAITERYFAVLYSKVYLYQLLSFLSGKAHNSVSAMVSFAGHILHIHD